MGERTGQLTEVLKVTLIEAHTFHTTPSSWVAGMRELFMFFYFHVVGQKCVKANETEIDPSIFFFISHFRLGSREAHGSCRWVGHTFFFKKKVKS